jgi:hypothetical protein
MLLVAGEKTCAHQFDRQWCLRGNPGSHIKQCLVDIGRFGLDRRIEIIFELIELLLLQ